MVFEFNQIEAIRPDASAFMQLMYEDCIRIGMNQSDALAVGLNGGNANPSKLINKYEIVATTLLENLRQVAAQRGRKGIRAAVDTQDELLMVVLETNGAKRVSRTVGSIAIHGVTRNYLLYGINPA